MNFAYTNLGFLLAVSLLVLHGAFTHSNLETHHPTRNGSCPYAHALKQKESVQKPSVQTENFYSKYIKPDKLALQYPREGEPNEGLQHHDEHIFILVHQQFELYFAHIVYELKASIRLVNEQLESKVAIQVARYLRRCSLAFRKSLDLFELLEGMNHMDFLEFRSHLGNGSGFQSVRMRQIEILMGLKSEERAEFKQGGCPMAYHDVSFTETEKKKFLEMEQDGNTLKIKLYTWLRSFNVSASFKEEFSSKHEQGLIKRFGENSVQLQTWRSSSLNSIQWAALYIATYRDDYWSFFDLIEAVIEFEESIVLWRVTHPRMVERMIGKRTGTGGTSGVEYLDNTAKIRVFSDLWHVRTLCIATSAFGK
jgi:tryptophan 2,3-dioxygenase